MDRGVGFGSLQEYRYKVVHWDCKGGPYPFLINDRSYLRLSLIKMLKEKIYFSRITLRKLYKKQKQKSVKELR